MQSSQQISFVQLEEVVEAVFAQGPVVVRQAYSDIGYATREFAEKTALLDDLNYEMGVGNVFRQYTIYYLEAKGHTHERRIELNSPACNGHSFRFCQEGWGLIQLQCDFRTHPIVDCRIAVNSHSRATKWRDVYPEFQSPHSWDWTAVEKKAGRLIRLLRRLGKDCRRKAGKSSCSGR